MKKEENQCLTRRESETSKPSFKKRSDKLATTTRTTWPFKERVNWLLRKLKDSKPKCKEKEDKPWHKKNSSTKSWDKWKNKIKDSNNKANPNKARPKRTKHKPRNLKGKASNLKESLNKWEDKAIYRKRNLMKSEDNLKVKEERVLQFKLLCWTFKKRTSAWMIKSGISMMSWRKPTEISKLWLTNWERLMKSLTRSVMKITSWREKLTEPEKVELKKEVDMVETTGSVEAHTVAWKLTELKSIDSKTKLEASEINWVKNNRESET